MVYCAMLAAPCFPSYHRLDRQPAGWAGFSVRCMASMMPPQMIVRICDLSLTT